MASAPSSSSEQQSLTCDVCLGILEDPRLLPHCHHTFCTKCIQGVADRHPRGSFPCPSCRRQTALPAEGVDGFQRNFYIQPKHLERARKGVHYCTAHPKDEVDLYCADCGQPACLKCVLTKHKQHTTEDLSVVVEKAISQLQQDKTRLVEAMTQIENKMDTTRKSQQALQNDKEAVKNTIRTRHAVILAAAIKSRDEALTSLDDVVADTERKLASDLRKEQRDADAIRLLQENVQTAIERGAVHELVHVAREMEMGSGSSHSISLLTSQNRTTVTPLVLNNTTTAEVAAKHISDFIGTATRSDVRTDHQNPASLFSSPFDRETLDVDSQTESVEKFNIAEEPGTEVFSMCVTDNGNLVLSYAWRRGREDACSEEFSFNGTRVSEYNQLRGKVSWKSTGPDSIPCEQSEGRMITFSKSKTHFALHNNLLGKATVKRATSTSSDPCSASERTEFIIRCGPHRSFDVDSTGQLFAIVIESRHLGEQRKVRLFQRTQQNTVAERWTYQSNIRLFQPTDVCFYKNAGEEVLLISDDINNAIHGVLTRHGRPKCVLYLCSEEYPLLTEPTALTVDRWNRLWVACRGRRILIIEPQNIHFGR